MTDWRGDEQMRSGSPTCGRRSGQSTHQLACSWRRRTSVISGIVHFRSKACEALLVSS